MYGYLHTEAFFMLNDIICMIWARSISVQAHQAWLYECMYIVQCIYIVTITYPLTWFILLPTLSHHIFIHLFVLNGGWSIHNLKIHFPGVFPFVVLIFLNHGIFRELKKIQVAIFCVDLPEPLMFRELKKIQVAIFCVDLPEPLIFRELKIIQVAIFCVDLPEPRDI